MDGSRSSTRENITGFTPGRELNSNSGNRRTGPNARDSIPTVAKLRQGSAGEETKDKDKWFKSHVLRTTSALFSSITRRGSSQSSKENQPEQDKVKQITAKLESPNTERFPQDQRVIPTQTSYPVTQHQLMRPYGPPLPRSQTCGCLGNPAAVVPVADSRDEVVVGCPDDKYQDAQANAEDSDANSPSSTLRRTLKTTPPRRTSTLDPSNAPATQVGKSEDTKLLAGLEARVFRQSGIIAKARPVLIKSQSEVLSRSLLPQPVRGDYTPLQVGTDPNCEPCLDPLPRRQSRRNSNLPRAIQGAPSTRERKGVNAILKDFEAKEAIINQENSPMKGKLIQARERLSGLGTKRSAGIGLRNSVFGGRNSPATEQLVSVDEVQDAALFSAAAAAKKRRQNSRLSLGMAPGPSVQSGTEPVVPTRSRIPTPRSVSMQSASPEAENLVVRERQYRPAARMSLNYPTSGARTPSYASQHPLETPGTPMRRKEVDMDYAETIRNSPTPLCAPEDRRRPGQFTAQIKPSPTAHGRIQADEDEILSSHPLPLARGDHVRGPMPTAWWLGRYTSVVNRLRSEELQTQLSQAVGAGIAELGIGPEDAEHPNPGMLDAESREAAAITELRALCANQPALNGLERFLDAKRERDGRGGTGPTREEQERAAVIRRLGVDALKMGELRARVEAQRVKREEARAQPSEAGSSNNPINASEGFLAEDDSADTVEADRTDTRNAKHDDNRDRGEKLGVECARDGYRSEVRQKVTLFGKLAAGKRKPSPKT